MKNPDEIKKGLECCTDGNVACTQCPYRDIAPDCSKALRADYRALFHQIEAERDAALGCIVKLMVILKTYPYAATNGCAYQAYMEIQKYLKDMRGVQKEE